MPEYGLQVLGRIQRCADQGHRDAAGAAALAGILIDAIDAFGDRHVLREDVDVAGACLAAFIPLAAGNHVAADDGRRPCRR